MAKISEFLNKIMSARYGKDVRQSIHDAIDQINKDVVYESENVTQKAQEVSENAENAKKYKDESEQIKSDVLKAKTDAETAKADALIAKSDAITAKTEAETAKSGAVTAKTAAETAKTDAITAKIEAETAAQDAAKSAQDALQNATSSIPDASATVAGKAKLYSETGSAEDGSITQKAVTDNLNKLSYNEIAGGKNLAFKKITNSNINENGILEVNTGFSIYIAKLAAGTYTLATDDGNGAVYGLFDSEPYIGSKATTGRIVSSSKIITVSNDCYIALRSSPNYAYGKVEIGTVSTPYEPYIMSNYILTNEIARKELELAELKMLGWSVPAECPIQNEVNGNQFIQKVGRVDLGSLKWAINSINSNPFSYTTYANAVTDLVTVSNTDEKVRCYSSDFSTDSAVNTIDKKTLRKFAVISNKRIYTYSSKLLATEVMNELKGKYLYYELETPIIKTIDGNEITSQSDDRIAVNILKPTFETQVLNGVTFTLNDDGTYRLNGTATQDMVVRLQENITLKSNTYYCFNTFFENENDFRSVITNNYNLSRKIAVGDIYCSFLVNEEHVSGVKKFFCALDITEGKIFSNTVVKPMLSEGTAPKPYVQYTGDTGALNSDVAGLQKEVEAVKGNVETLNNTVNGKAEKSYVDDVLNLIKDLNGANSPYLGNPNDAITGLYQFWGNYPEGSPFGVPYVLLSLRALNFCLQLASPYNGDGLAFRCRGAGVDEWSSWRYLSIR